MEALWNLQRGCLGCCSRALVSTLSASLCFFIAFNTWMTIIELISEVKLYQKCGRGVSSNTVRYLLNYRFQVFCRGLPGNKFSPNIAMQVCIVSIDKI